MNDSLKVTVGLLIVLCLMLGGTLYLQTDRAQANEKILLQGMEEMQQINKELQETHLLNEENSNLFKRDLDLLKQDIERLEGSKKDLEKENQQLKEANEKLKMQISLKNETKTRLAKEKSSAAVVVTQTVKKATEPPQKNSNQATKKAVAPTSHKVAYLTFDDGPSHNTTKVLDILKKNNIKATFFVNGKNTAEANSLYKRIVAEGHSIGNHTYSHDYASIYKSKDQFMASLLKMEQHILSLTGVKMDIVRFPGGSNNRVSWQYGGKNLTQQIATELTAKGYVYYDWNVDSTDASKVNQSKTNIVNGVLQGTKGQKQINVLMHDASPKNSTASALPEIIIGLRDQGYSFDRITKNTTPNQFLKP